MSESLKKKKKTDYKREKGNIEIYAEQKLQMKNCY